MIPFTDLNVGFANAENYRKRENKELLSKYFVRDSFLEKLLDTNIYFLVGEKGTGKTAYSTYLRNNFYKGNRSFAYDVRQTEYQKFLEMKRRGHLPLSQYSEVWRTILLILLATSVIDAAGTPEFLQRFTKLASLKKAIDEFYRNAFAPEIVKILDFVESAEASNSLIAKHTGIGAEVKETRKAELKEPISLFQTHLLELRRSFEEALDSLNLGCNHTVFIDGIDVRPPDIAYADYFDCVRGLNDAVWALNNDFLANIKDSLGRMRVVLLIRPDIFMRTGLHNVNTKLRDNAVFLNWATTYKDYRTSSLFKVADRLLAAQQPEPQMQIGDAWDRYFPFHAENVRSIEGDRQEVSSFLSFVRFSYYRPRDINAMIGTMKEILARKGTANYVTVSDFADPSFRDAHADYLLGEIRDQLLFYYSQEEYDLFLQFFFFLNGRRKFSFSQFVDAYNTFITECTENGKKIPQFFESANTFLQFIYEQNVICFFEKDELDDEHEPFIRWCFRERTLSNLSPKVRTHVDYEIFYGLSKALNVGRPIKISREKPTGSVGTVVRINAEGFGFIRGGPRQLDYYFKGDQVLSKGRPLQVGDKVTFDVKVKYGKLRLRTLYQSQNVTIAAMQMAEKKMWAQRS